MNNQNEYQSLKDTCDQGQGLSPEKAESDLFKISPEKSSENSELFELSQSKNSKHLTIASKCNKEDVSEIFKDEISTLKDFSHLLSSKTGSGLVKGTFNKLLKTEDKADSEVDSSRPCWSTKELPLDAPDELELNHHLLFGSGKTYDCTEKDRRFGLEMDDNELNEIKSTYSTSLYN